MAENNVRELDRAQYASEIARHLGNVYRSEGHLEGALLQDQKELLELEIVRDELAAEIVSVKANRDAMTAMHRHEKTENAEGWRDDANSELRRLRARHSEVNRRIAELSQNEVKN